MPPAKLSLTDRHIHGLSLILAPILLSLSTFFWQNGEYNTTSASFLIFSLLFWIPALTALFAHLKPTMPIYAGWGLLVATYGCISGVCFAFLGYLTAIFAIPHQQYLKALENYPLSAQLLLFSGGPLFPLSLFLLGFFLIRKKQIPVLSGSILCLGAIAFPLSRISRVEAIAHAADLLLAISCVLSGFTLLKSSE